MKTLLSLIITLVSLSAFAASSADDPSGTWKWKLNAKGHEIESTLQLILKDGKLAGTIDNRAGKAEIKNGIFANGDISFFVEREFRRKKISTRYQGHLDGNAINGTATMTGAKDGEPASTEWHATRS